MKGWLPRFGFDSEGWTLCLDDGEVEGWLLWIEWRSWRVEICGGTHNGRFR